MPASDITVTATYVDAHLTVNHGTIIEWSTNSEQVAIAANVYTGKTFVAWTGEVAAVACVDNVTNAFAFVTMPTNDITLTATYVDVYYTYTLTVNDGTGSGAYTNGTQVMIEAYSPIVPQIWPPMGRVFAAWIGDIQYVANIYSSATTVTMPAANITVSATYTYVPPPGGGDDSDGDGLKDWEEYIAGTNPSNAASCFKTMVQSTPNKVSWSPVVSGRVYSVYWSTNLAKGFSNLVNNIPYPISSYTNTTPASKFNYYQIKVRLQSP
jgi:uncharacterized repeat protein (TIGR02543 family)